MNIEWAYHIESEYRYIVVAVGNSIGREKVHSLIMKAAEICSARPRHSFVDAGLEHSDVDLLA